jgi:predicted DNA-binding transcriptional regulator AlpA
MDTYAFRIRLRDRLSDAEADSLYEAFDEEVAVEEGPKGHFIGFDREAKSFLDAALSALKEVIALGFEPLSVDDELVSMADIAELTGRTRQSVSMLVSGRRGSGDFPRPVAGNVRSPLWHWADVVAWFASQEDGPGEYEDRLSTIAAINGVLANRVLSRDHPADLERIQRLLAS